MNEEFRPLIALVETYDTIRASHAHRKDYKEAIDLLLNELEEYFGKENFFPYRNRIESFIGNGNWNEAIFFLNHLNCLFRFPHGQLSKIQINKSEWETSFLKEYREALGIEEKDIENIFFKVLVVDDFFFLHLKEFMDIERKTAAEKENGTIPIIDFEFECLLSEVKRRLEAEHFDLILLDLDFGQQSGDPKNVIDDAREKNIPVILYSKYEKIDEYKKYIGGVRDVITKPMGKDTKIEEKVKVIFKNLQSYYEIEVFENEGWLIFERFKLPSTEERASKIGFYKNCGLEKFLDNGNTESGNKIKIVPMSTVDEYFVEESKKEGEKGKKDSLIVFIPEDTRENKKTISIEIRGKIPKYIKSIKYQIPISERFKDYGIEISHIDTKIEKNDYNYESLKLYLDKHHIKDSIVFDEKSKEDVEKETLRKAFCSLMLDLPYIVIPIFPPTSLLDIVGPVTIGPSSSHTAGANRIARLARNFAKAVIEKGEKIRLIVPQMLNTFYDTGEGHGSDRAIAAGLCGKKQYDKSLPNALKEPGRNNANIIDKRVSECGDGKIKINDESIEVEKFYWDSEPAPHLHSNSLCFHFYSNRNDYKKGSKPNGDFKLTAQSIGGGNVQISNIEAKGKEVKINDLDPIGSEFKENLNNDTTFLNGKRDIKVKIAGKEYNIESIFESKKEEFEFLGEGKVIIGVAEIPVSQKKIKTETPEWAIAEEQKLAMKRPEFLTLDDLPELGKRFSDYKNPVEIAIDYEKWVWAEQLELKIEKKFVIQAFKNYRKVMLLSAEEGVLCREKSETSYIFNMAHNLYIRSNEKFKNIAAQAMIYAMGVNELNVKMNFPLIAAPTTGSSGVVPGVLKAVDDYLQAKGWDVDSREEKETEGLIVASLIGLIITNVVPPAGAKHGCQAEIGIAAGMAAAMATHILGGTTEVCIHAAVLTLKDSLGLVCDPLEGKVEVPCIKRAALKAAEAIHAAFMALNGIRSEVTPSDVIRAMKEIGDHMLSIYKETSKGGLALTRRARLKRRPCLS